MESDDMFEDASFIEMMTRSVYYDLMDLYTGNADPQRSYDQAYAAKGLEQYAIENCTDVFEAARRNGYDILNSSDDLVIVTALDRFIQDTYQPKDGR